MENKNKNKLNLKQLEKKAYKSTFQDGLWDIFMGMIFLGFLLLSLEFISQLDIIYKYFLVVAPWNLGAVLILVLGKRYITIPRLGYVEFGPKRQKVKFKMIVFVIANIVALTILIILPLSGILENLQIEQPILALLIGFLVIWLPLSLLAFILKFPRLYLYAAMGGSSFFLTEIFFPLLGAPLDSIITFGLIGGLIVAIGLTYLIVFIRKYPKAEDI